MTPDEVPPPAPLAETEVEVVAGPQPLPLGALLLAPVLRTLLVVGLAVGLVLASDDGPVPTLAWFGLVVFLAVLFALPAGIERYAALRNRSPWVAAGAAYLSVGLTTTNTAAKSRCGSSVIAWRY